MKFLWTFLTAVVTLIRSEGRHLRARLAAIGRGTGVLVVVFCLLVWGSVMVLAGVYLWLRTGLPAAAALALTALVALVLASACAALVRRKAEN